MERKLTSEQKQKLKRATTKNKGKAVNQDFE
jgi:hypothetical protein